MVINRKEFKAIVERVRKIACSDDSIKQAIKEVGERVAREKKIKGCILEPKIYEMLDDIISTKIADIISELNISWEEIVEIYSETRINFDEVDSSEKRNVVEGVFFSLVQVKFIESITNELISKAQ